MTDTPAPALSLAPGMADCLAQEDRFADDAEAAAFWAEGAPDVPTEDLSYPGAAGQPQPLRLYRGALPAPAPTLVYIHGGGWTGGSIALNESACRTLAAGSGWTVASLSYRLAPVHPYPAGLDDCRAGLSVLRDRAAALGLGAGRMALGGASAGANLALAAALAEDRAALAGLLLIYGVFGDDLDTHTYRTYAEAPGLTRARMGELFDLYDPDRRRHDDPLVAPLHADLAGLPPCCLIAAEHDVLRADSEILADRLRAAGVPATLHTEPGVTHGFINRARLVPAAAASLARAVRFLGELPPSSW